MTSAKRNNEFDMARRGKARRVALGLSREEVAARLRCTYKNVSILECDGAASMRIIRKWAAALEMKPSALAFGEEG